MLTYDMLCTVNNRGFHKCPEAEGTIDIYAKNGVLTHASRLLNGRWESKLGVGIRMTHPRKALIGPNSLYGNIIASYKYDRSLDPARRPLPMETVVRSASQDERDWMAAAEEPNTAPDIAAPSEAEDGCHGCMPGCVIV